jgi:hypothetical protein
MRKTSVSLSLSLPDRPLGRRMTRDDLCSSMFANTPAVAARCYWPLLVNSGTKAASAGTFDPMTIAFDIETEEQVLSRLKPL